MKPWRQSIAKKRRDYGGEDSSGKVSTIKAHGDEASVTDDKSDKVSTSGPSRTQKHPTKEQQ